MEANLNEYSTKDLHLAAFLSYKKLPVIRLYKQVIPSQRFSPVYFIFNDKRVCQELEHAYWNKEGEKIIGNIPEYVEHVASLRSRINSTA